MRRRAADRWPGRPDRGRAAGQIRARSAASTRCSGRLHDCGIEATPILAVTLMEFGSRSTTRRAISRRMRGDGQGLLHGGGAAGSRRIRRDSGADRRFAVQRLPSATMASTSSPTRWPNVLFTCLNRSSIDHHQSQGQLVPLADVEFVIEQDLDLWRSISGGQPVHLAEFDDLAHDAGELAGQDGGLGKQAGRRGRCWSAISGPQSLTRIAAAGSAGRPRWSYHPPRQQPAQHTKGRPTACWRRPGPGLPRCR